MLAKTHLTFLLIFLATASITPPAHAQLVWDPNGVLGGSGTWDATTSNWYQVPTFSYVVWNSGAAHFTGTPGTVTLNSSLNATGLRFNISGYTISGSGTLTLTGGLPGFLSAVQTGSATHDINVPLVTAGRLSIASPLTGPTSVTFNLGANNAFTNGFVLSGPNVRLNLNAPQSSGSGPGAGPIFVETSITRISNRENAAPLIVTIPNEVLLNSTHQPDAFQTVIGATAPASSPTSPATQSALVFSGVISGDSDVIISNSVTGGGGGTTVFANAMTYTGKTILNHSAESGVFLLGVTNALPTGTNVVFGNGTANFAVGLFDLNGFDLQVASLSTNLGTGSSSTLGLTNSGSVMRTLTLSGSGTNTYAGKIGTVNNSTWFTGGSNPGGTDNIGLVLSAANTGTQILTGNNTYSGGTTVSGGTLLVNGQTGTNSGTGNGSVTVNGGTFGGTGRAAGSVSVLSGGTIRGGDANGIGTLTIHSGLSTSASATVGIRLTGGSASGTLGGSTIGPIPNPTSNNFIDVTGGILAFDSATNFQIDGTGNSFTVGSPYSYQIGRRAGQNLTSLSLVSPSQFTLIGFEASTISVTGNASGDIFLSFTPVPEPSLILGIGFAVVGLGRCIRRNTSPN